MKPLYLHWQSLWRPNIAVWWFNLRGSVPKSRMTLELRELERSLYKLKTLYLHDYSVCCQQIWQRGDLQWRSPAHKVTWSFQHIVLWSHLIYYICYASFCTRWMKSMHGTVVSYCEGLLSITKSNTSYLHLQRRWWFTMTGSKP